MLLRDCEGLYRCGNGTEESCAKAFCPFYHPDRQARTPAASKPIKANKKKSEGHWILDDFSMLWRYVED